MEFRSGTGDLRDSHDHVEPHRLKSVLLNFVLLSSMLLHAGRLEGFAHALR